MDGPTIKALTALICDFPSIPAGRLGLDGRPGQAAGSPSTPPQPTQTGPQMVAEGKQILKDLERTLMALRFKLLHQTPTTMAWLNKHFETAKVKVTPNEREHAEQDRLGDPFPGSRVPMHSARRA